MRALKTIIVAGVVAISTHASALDPATGGADETALRFYAATKDQKRVEAETRRLQAQYPGWTPPADLWASELGRADEEEFWTLFAADKLDALQSKIDARMAADTKWKPSRDLSRKIEAKRLRLAILAHVKVSNWYGIAGLSRQIDLGVNAADAELLWIAAEASARSGDFDAAKRFLETALKAASDRQVRKAVLLRALALLPFAKAQELLSLAASDEANELAIDVARAKISGVLRDEPNIDVAAQEIGMLAASARDTSDPNESELLGWHALKRGDVEDALAWFKLSITKGGSGIPAHGLAHTLSRRNQPREAEEVAYAWRKLVSQNSILFVDLLETKLTAPKPPDISADRLARYGREVVETQSGEGAQGLAWYSYNSCQYDKALEWFERAVAWHPKEATVFGYALTLLRLKRTREFAEVVNRYDGLFPSVVGLAFDNPDKNERAVCETGGSEPAVASPPIASRDGVRAIPHANGAFASASGLPVLRTNFPAAVHPANPLRFSAWLEKSRAAAGASGWRTEATSPSLPLVARRVAGVTAMPYERFGFALLPGYDKSEQPASRSTAETPAPLGTQAARDRHAEAGTTPRLSPRSDMRFGGIR